MAGTPWIVADNSAAGLTSQLGSVWASLRSLGAGLTDEEWAAPSPCPGWPVSALYAHMIGTESVLLGRPNPEVDPGSPPHVRNDIGKFNEAWVVSLAGESREEVLRRFDEVTEQRARALAGMGEDDFSAESWTPIGKSDYRRFMQIRVFDCWVHEQDVRDTVGRPGPEDGPTAEQSVDEIARAFSYLVGKKAGAPDGSSVTVELTGPVRRELHAAVVEGRARTVESLDGPASAHVSLSSKAFTRLACGRVDPASVLGGALGGARTQGDVGLGRRLVENLAFTI
ncbi:MAG: maleylpyruvate isomerase family mycothiol-dependent enzyme [Acidimicrobiales bacterium]